MAASVHIVHTTSHAIWVDEITDIMVTIKRSKKLKHFEKIIFWNKFHMIFHFLSLCVFISIQNIGGSIPLNLGVQRPHHLFLITDLLGRQLLHMRQSWTTSPHIFLNMMAEVCIQSLFWNSTLKKLSYPTYKHLFYTPYQFYRLLHIHRCSEPW